MSTTRIVVIAKAPQPGRVKTRLIPALGAEGAAALAARMLACTLVAAFEAAGAADTADPALGVVELCASPAPGDPAWQGVVVPAGLRWSAQGEGDLGARMAGAARRVLAGGERVLLIGTDCPALDAACLRTAAEALDEVEAVIVPSFDGGYVLLGLRRFDPSLFEGIAWSTSTVAAATRVRLDALAWSYQVLPALQDIDVPADLVHLPSAG
ncbi:MAG TPA: TIGR04282 family arsenosugar biosynthesis glycosyltransferase [Thauera aminoaromatica]|nr:MAG: 2-phospho-L-lactate guanylyltransferase [Alphaproteobacteria bacterium ADurb.BinA305]HMV92835.1 TIGR04282 family arsenosugar biosynthesis glycosyltransferase [Thauera aminoaromatica]HNB05731.1 TIGR04282 family arsenosugar biosynthesis glycosyltransferase [Thauera aminoaromatica]HNE99310.1 TIGR04282 family arsenosugar biosynthesis glycosyltransferase [Thauera aminoaromatica]HNF76855.1 TIGR04282 family arsenosugar biosynthesis glycosyltransferase [Thauera aminoaromatica]